MFTCFHPLQGIFSIFVRAFGTESVVMPLVLEIRKHAPNCRMIYFASVFTRGAWFVDPVLIKQFFNDDQELNYRKFDRMFMLDKIVTRGLLWSNGDQWRAQRKFFSTLFHYDVMQQRIPLMQQVCSEIITDLRARLAHTPDAYQVINVVDEVERITGEIVIRSFFGEELKNKLINGKNLTTELNELVALMFRQNFMPSFWLKV